MLRGWTVVVVLGSVFLLAGCEEDVTLRRAEVDVVTPSSSGVPAPSATPTETSDACPKSGLRPRVLFSDSAMGSRLVRVAVDNCGTVPVKLAGYPHPTLLDEDGAPLAIAVRHGYKSMGDQKPPEPTKFTLAPGESAETGLTWRNTLVDYTKNVAGTALLFDETGVPVELVVDAGDTGELFVSAWEPTKGP